MVEVFPDAAALMRGAALRFVSAASSSIARSGRCVVALSGGSTPAALYDLLASEFRSGVDWSRVQLCFGDERCVPPNHADSNYRMARERLLERVQVPAGNVHRIEGELEPQAAAAKYEALLRKLFDTPAGPPAVESGKRFDLVLLGLGEDGHTASLFPGTKAVEEAERWVVPVFVKRLNAWRVTLTTPVFDAAAEVCFLVSGAGKSGTLRRVLKDPVAPQRLPAQVIAPHHGTLRWLVDSAAAIEL